MRHAVIPLESRLFIILHRRLDIFPHNPSHLKHILTYNAADYVIPHPARILRQHAEELRPEYQLATGLDSLGPYQTENSRHIMKHDPYGGMPVFIHMG